MEATIHMLVIHTGIVLGNASQMALATCAASINPKKLLLMGLFIRPNKAQPTQPTQ